MIHCKRNSHHVSARSPEPTGLAILRKPLPNDSSFHEERRTLPPLVRPLLPPAACCFPPLFLFCSRRVVMPVVGILDISCRGGEDSRSATSLARMFILSSLLSKRHIEINLFSQAIYLNSTASSGRTTPPL